MNGDSNFLSKRIEETTSELSAVREKLQAVQDQLSEAEGVLKFYANPKSYSASRGEEGFAFQDKVRDDHTGADNAVKILIAGKRARNYLKKYQRED